MGKVDIGKPALAKSQRLGPRGFYLTIDITLATVLTLVILLILIITLANLPGSVMIEAANYKVGESVLYSLENRGTLDTMVQYLDDGNTAAASSEGLSALSAMDIVMNARLEIVTYNSGMGIEHSFALQNGPIGKRAYAITLPFWPNATTSKYGIATLLVGD